MRVSVTHNRLFRSIGTMSVVWIVSSRIGSVSQRELKSQPDSAAARRSRWTMVAGRGAALAAVARSSRQLSSRGVSRASQ